MTRETQVKAYREIQNKLPKRHNQVLSILKTGNYTAQEIADKLNLPINCITGRIRELYMSGKVCEKGIKINPITKRKVVIWGIVKSPFEYNKINYDTARISKKELIAENERLKKRVIELERKLGIDGGYLF